MTSQDLIPNIWVLWDGDLLYITSISDGDWPEEKWVRYIAYNENESWTSSGNIHPKDCIKLNDEQINELKAKYL
jgi:hypothetical protein